MDREVLERLNRQDQRILDLEAQVQNILSSLFEETNVAPTKPREGIMRYADGTNWNPGGGRGLYHYQAGAWVKL